MESGQKSRIQADFTIGADGPHSFARGVIGSALEGDPRPLYSQDVIFEADLEKYVAGRKGALLYNATPSGVLTFQPLNGVTRWRCQIFKPDASLLSNEETIARIREAVGSDDEIPISITSTGIWQPTPGCVDRIVKGRIFLAGDSAHVSVPTGGMGNNIGFAGIRNLAWKLAFVIQGHSSRDILGTYQTEHRPVALQRVATGVQTTDYMAKIFFAYYGGQDPSEGVRETHQYADYDGVLLGFELKSPLVAENDTPPPAVENETRDFVPAIRSGRRAPHVWIDRAAGTSVLDWFGLEYVLLVGAGADSSRWRQAVAGVRESTGFPVCVHEMPIDGVAPYGADELVLVRPDGIIADHWRDSDPETRLNDRLPIKVRA